MLTCKEYTDLRKKELKEYIEEKGLHPKLVVIQVGDRPESNSYIRGKMRDCEEVGIECVVSHWEEEDMDQCTLSGIIDIFNNDEDVNGIIVQLPLPGYVNVKEIQEKINPMKDVDGFKKNSPFDPCTPKGVRDFLVYIGYEFEGKDALVIGRSPIVGKPLARMLTDLDCTVTLAHSKTKDLDNKMTRADIMFTCIDKIEHFHGAIGLGRKIDLIDIGLGVGTDGKLHGNWDHESVEIMKKYLRGDQVLISGTGGVGLLTRLALVENVVKAAELQKG